MTIRRLMLLVLVVAGWLGSWSYLRRWEDRRVVLYQQRDATRAAMSEAKEAVASTGREISKFRMAGDLKTYTTHWTERLEVYERLEGVDVPLIRAVVSGSNGRFTLPPITVETDGSPLDRSLLDRLIRVYERNGWEYRIRRGGAGR